MDVVEESSTFSVAVVGRVIVVAANGVLTVAHVALLSRAYERMGDGRFASITLSQTSRPGADDDARKALGALSARFKDRDVGSAVVMIAPGFAAAVVRGIVSGLTLIAGGNIKVYGDVDSGMAWLEQVVTRAKLEQWDSKAVKQALVGLAERQLKL